MDDGRGVPVNGYRTVVADPPWAYRSAGPTRAGVRLDGAPLKGVSSAERYGSMRLDELARLRPPAADDAHLYLWATNAFLEAAHGIARAWGFDPKTILTWVKVHQDDPGRVSMKTGHYFRGATEHVVFAVRGSLPLQVDEGLPTAYLWPRPEGGHSVKPDAFLDLVERASPGPYLEMFARRQRFGWDTWGAQALPHVDLGASG